jgi:NAD(P)-dependent dehydrogenase (short-subunit alcohol dehydrogenase family)
MCCLCVLSQKYVLPFQNSSFMLIRLAHPLDPRACAAAASLGCAVTIASRKVDQLRAAAERIKQELSQLGCAAPGRVHVVQCDLKQPDTIDACIREAVAQMGRCVGVHCSGSRSLCTHSAGGDGDVRRAAVAASLHRHCAIGSCVD